MQYRKLTPAQRADRIIWRAFHSPRSDVVPPFKGLDQEIIAHHRAAIKERSRDRIKQKRKMR